MNNFFVLLKRFVPPYKKYVVLSLSLNLLSTIFSLFSFAAIKTVEKRKIKMNKFSPGLTPKKKPGFVLTISRFKF